MLDAMPKVLFHQKLELLNDIFERKSTILKTQNGSTVLETVKDQEMTLSKLWLQDDRESVICTKVRANKYNFFTEIDFLRSQRGSQCNLNIEINILC